MAISFFGGVHPSDGKALTRFQQITPFPAPDLVTIPLSQHIGAPCKPLVKKGDKVLMGQMLGDGEGLCVPVHASVSGTVKAIEPRSHPGGTTVMSVVIENDGAYTPDPAIAPRSSIDDLTPQELTDIIRRAGIVGMGGATFPTHVKLTSGMGKVDTIILNASECEPYITADERLLTSETELCMKGLEVFMKILGLKEAVVAMEKGKPQAAAAVRQAIEKHPGIRLQLLPARYPQGAEKQLIQAVTGRQVPPGGLPAQVGCAVFNAATCAAVCEAVWEGMPLIRRIVTVSGDIAMSPRNFRVFIGTPFNVLIDAVGPREHPYKVLSGGPMMGAAQFDLAVPVIKGVNAVTILGGSNKYVAEHPHCIRCGKCIEVCPMHLMPLYLYSTQQKGDVEAMKRENIMDCMECGCCAFTCPACIPLVHSIRTGKQKLRDSAPPPAAKK